VVSRDFDEKRNLQIVTARFDLQPGLSLFFIGAPEAEMGDILLQIRGRMPRASADCAAVEILVNGKPVAGERTDRRYEGTKPILGAHFQFEHFKPLAQRFPSFGVRHCEYEMKFNEKQVDELRKFLVIYSDLATEIQEQAEPVSTEEA
jgi:hypothetical protein